MNVPDKIVDLVERFDRNKETYTRGKYNETQLRREFVDPFFKALGWDVDNEQGHAEAYKEVIHEDAIKVGREGTKAPDYCFRIGGARKFFVEAKKPSVNIEHDIAPAYQLRRYAWSAKLPLSILTDFEELAVYDCREKPIVKDKASKARVFYLKYNEYIKRWDEIAGIFSRDEILKGSFDKYVESNKAKRGTSEVDDAFLQEIERWRELLAKNIALRNPELSQRHLNFAVQLTIDRLVFLRICEDRGIENYGQLKTYFEKKDIYKNLFQLFKNADARYNSGLFHFQDEKNRSGSSDNLTPKLQIDDKTLKDIIKNLYYPDSPYEFSVLPTDVLGHVYERFLGKIIRITSSGRAKIEEKPEVKKAGGVFYTPTFIVEYIVKNTVGKLLEDKSPNQVENIKILDPACGSGSFLLGAFQYLLEWHKEFYINDDPKKWTKKKKPRIYQAPNGDWKLTIDERKRILLNNIYGVDIDSQAVEVTKLSLLLKVLEGEDEATIGQTLSLFQERALPDLCNNIKCGNSLIGPDFYNGEQLSFLDDEAIYRVNPFSWKKEFPSIISAGGFDAVIGNPPYIRILAMKEWAPQEAGFYKKNYKTASEGNYDIYVVFVEKGLELLNTNGLLGFIMPHKFFNAQYGKYLREIIAEGRHLDKIVHFGDQQIFTSATTYTCLLFLKKKGGKAFHFVKAHDLPAWIRGDKLDEGDIQAESVTSAEWNFIVGQGNKLFEKLSNMPVRLGNIADRIFQGLVTGADPVFLLESVSNSEYKSAATGKIYKLEKELLHPLCKGSVNIRRYYVSGVSKSILFPYKLIKGKAHLLTTIELSRQYPETWAYLKENRQLLEAREKGKWKHEKWYAFGRSQNLSEMEQCKILTPSIASHVSFTLDSEGYFYFVGSGGGGGGGYGITLKEDHLEQNYFYLLGLLNSKLLDWYLRLTSSPFRGGYFSYNRQYIEPLPIRIIDFKSSKDKQLQSQIIELVKKILDLNSRLSDDLTPDEKKRLERQIEAVDRQIDRIVYQLHDLTPEEIKTVEAG